MPAVVLNPSFWTRLVAVAVECGVEAMLLSVTTREAGAALKVAGEDVMVLLLVLVVVLVLQVCVQSLLLLLWGLLGLLVDGARWFKGAPTDPAVCAHAGFDEIAGTVEFSSAAAREQTSAGPVVGARPATRDVVIKSQQGSPDRNRAKAGVLRRRFCADRIVIPGATDEVPWHVWLAERTCAADRLCR